jgi:hypothetical protein
MNKIKYHTLLVILMTLTTFFPLGKAYAEGTDLTLSLGNICEYVGKFQTNENGDKNFCSFMPYLASSFDIPLANGFYLAPQVGASLPQSGKDENVKRMVFFALANGKYKINLLTLTAGLGLYFTRIWGPGGEAVLNNGTGTDSFPLPEEAVYTRNFILNLGAGAQITKEISAELYTYIFNAAKSEDRSLSIGVSATYHFGEVL